MLDRIARAFALSGAMVALFVLLRSAALALSGQRRFETFLNICLYFIVPAFTAALLSGVLWLRPLARAHVLLLCVSIAVSAYAVELAVISTGITAQPLPAMTKVGFARDREAAANQLRKVANVHIDLRTVDEVMAELRKTDPDSIPVVTPNNHLLRRASDESLVSRIVLDGAEVVPLAGPSQRNTLLCNEDGRWISYRSDRHGFNNPDRAWQAERIEIAVLGDSFAHGYCVPSEKSFPALLARGAHTLNLGIAGDGPLMMLATLTERLPPVEPEVVLWCYFEGNDLEDLQVERQSPVLLNYLQRGFTQPLLRRQSDIDAAMLAEGTRLEVEAGQKAADDHRLRAAAHRVVEFMKLTSLRLSLGLITPTLPRDLQRQEDFETTNMDVFREVLRQAKARTAEWNGRLYFVYLPSWERYSPRYRSRGNLKRDEVLAMANALQLPIVDLEPEFRATGDPQSLFPFRALGHYSEAGQQVVADAIARRLVIDRSHDWPRSDEAALEGRPVTARSSAATGIEARP